MDKRIAELHRTGLLVDWLTAVLMTPDLFSDGLHEQAARSKAGYIAAGMGMHSAEFPLPGAPAWSIPGQPVASALRELGKNAQGYDEYENPIDGTVLIALPGGSFKMGSPDGVGDDDEHPQHDVTLSAYLIAKNPVTQAQYRKFCEATNRTLPTRPSWSLDTHPVVNVSWDDAKAYCAWAGLALLTEAQWEFAARGGKQLEYGTADGTISHELANYYQDGGKNATSPVGSFPANPYGIFDLSGNVWEWCEDRYGSYTANQSVDPTGAAAGSRRVLRGGSWYDLPVRLRSAYRFRFVPGYQYSSVGFRVARAPS